MAGEHHLNPVARANSVAKQQIRVLDIGEGLALMPGAAFNLVTAKDEEGKEWVVVICTGAGGKPSDLVPFAPVPILLGEIARLPIESVRGAINATLEAK